MVLRIRSKLAQYQEIYYMIFILSMTGMTSVALFSDDLLYKYVFIVGLALFLLKMAVTDFTLREILIMGVFTILLGINLLNNGEKTMILTAMGIFGAKNVDLRKVMKYALWEKAVLTVGFIALAMLGVIENTVMSLPKNGELFEVYCYGYSHPNNGFANIFGIVVLAVIVYGERLKWYGYVVLTGIILLGYELFMCRTGLVAWVALCLMVLGYYIMKHFRKEKLYMMLFPVIPIVLTVLTMVFPVLARVSPQFDSMIHNLLTGRVQIVNRVYDDVWTLVLGHNPVASFDSIYFHLLYNYGWILFAMCLIAYVVGMCYSNKKGKYYETIALGVMAVYGYMEMLPLSVLWNLPLLYLAWVLFRERKVINEQLQ